MGAGTGPVSTAFGPGSDLGHRKHEQEDVIALDSWLCPKSHNKNRFLYAAASGGALFSVSSFSGLTQTHYLSTPQCGL